MQQPTQDKHTPHLHTLQTGPWWPEKLLPTLSAGFLALRLQVSTMPCSVPTINLVGPAWGSYSRHTPPSSTSLPFSLLLGLSWWVRRVDEVRSR